MTQIIRMRRSVFLFGLALFFLGGIALTFHEIVASWFQGLTPPPPGSIRGEWVGVMDMPTIRNPWRQPDGRHAVLRFTLKREPDYMTKYGGTGELTIEGQPPQPIEVTHLWLPDGQQAFECGLWKISYKEGDLSDYLSGGFEGSFRSGKLFLERQRALGYDLTGTLHKGTDQDYDELVRQLRQAPPRPRPEPSEE